MVTRILFDPVRDLPSGAATASPVVLEATPTGVRENGATFTVPNVLSFTVNTGADQVQLAPPGASWAWKIVVRNAATLTVLQQRTVRFADVASIAYQALTDVDPTSLGETDGHARQWDATFDQLTTLIGAGGGGGAVSSVAGRIGVVTLTKADVALGNVDNTSDAAKPISTAQAAVNAAKADLVAGVIPSSQIPALALTATVTVASQAAMLALTTTQVQPGDLAIRTDGAGTFILSAADPSQLASWTRLNAPTDVVTTVNGQQGTVVLAKADVGLDNVDNVSDAGKPVSTAQATAIAGKSLSLSVNAMSSSGTAVIGARNSVNASAGPVAVTMPTPTIVGQTMIIERADTSSTPANAITITGTIRGVANATVTLAAVGAAFEGALYIAESLTSWAIAASIKPRAVLDAAYAGLISPALTGTPTVPTATPGTSSTQVASTAFVKTALVATSAEVRALAAVVIDPTPPTITVQTGGGTPAGATSTLTGTIFKYDDTTNRCRYNGFRFEPRLWSGINIYAPRPPHTTDSKELTAGGLIGSLWTIDFDFYGDAFEICVVDSTQVRVITDGKYAQDAPVLGGGSGNFFFIKVQYATTAYRRVRIETGLNAANSLPGGWVHGIKFKTGQAHFAPSMPTTKRLALVHDSYGSGGLPTTADLRGYSAFLSRILGFTDYMNHCISGSGFTIGSTGNSQKYAPRIDDLAVAQPDYLLIMASVNDYSNRATTLPTEAASFFAACKTQLPNTRILCVGAMGMVQSNNDAINAVLSPVAATAGVEFLDTSGMAASLPAGLIGSDNYHPTVDGHQWIARQLGALIAARWQLPR